MINSENPSLKKSMSEAANDLVQDASGLVKDAGGLVKELMPPQINASQFRRIERLPTELMKTVAAMPEATKGSANLVAARFFRGQFIKLLSKLERGHITLIDSLGTESIGDQNADLQCEIRMVDIRSYTHIALSGANGSAQAYIDGLWSTDNLAGLIRIFVRNREVLNRMESGLAKLAQLLYRRWHARNKNTRSGSRKNIAAHYDLGNEFFRLFLDENMMYSSALYCHGDSLQQASDRKLQRICDALELCQDDHVLEIGSGWGGFACYAAKSTGCKITTITISQEQYHEASRRVVEQGLQAQVTVKLQDYRDVQGEFDKVVSIEMIEAVGHQYLDTYFAKINSVLKDNGKALIQAIVIDDVQYQSALKRVDYIKRYIFPGGFMPCYSVLSKFAAQNRLMLEDLHDMGLSYAQTLRDWRRRYYQRIAQIKAQGYGAEFRRMWEFYLCYCEGAFDERATSVGQILLRKQSAV